MFQTFASVVSLLVVCVPCARASVRVVAPTGAPYTTIQGAINASADGDTILVRSGTWTGFTVQGKSLTIAADPAGQATLSTSALISGSSATQPIVLTGFRFRPAANGGVQVLDCFGSVRLEDLLTLADPQPETVDKFAVRVENSPDVAILRCNLAGCSAIMAHFTHAAAAVLANNSRVAIYDSQITGGNGGTGFYFGTAFPAEPGEPACRMEQNSTLFASGSTFQGGRGGGGAGAACPPSLAGPGAMGGHGGDGLVVEPGSQATLVDDVLIGGLGGPGGVGAPSCNLLDGSPGIPGAPSSGIVTNLFALSRHVTTPTLVRELAPLTITLTGQPGDLVWLQIGGTPTWSLDVAFSGVRLVSTAQRSTRIFLGVMPPSGMLVHTLVFPDMGPGIEARINHVQALFRDTNGTNVLGSGEVFTLVDSAF